MKGQRCNPYFRKIMVGYDGSKAAEKAVDVALSPAHCMDAKMLIFAFRASASSRALPGDGLR
jgi:nucleotide-binding universal stress UspA family protein